MVHTFFGVFTQPKPQGHVTHSRGETHPGAKLNSGLKKFVVIHKTHSGVDFTLGQNFNPE